jgi:hypothetical protein
MYGWQESGRFDHETLANPIFNVTKPLHADAPGKNPTS